MSRSLSCFDLRRLPRGRFVVFGVVLPFSYASTDNVDVCLNRSLINNLDRFASGSTGHRR